MTFVGYPGAPGWGPDDIFWTLSPPESETHLAIGFSNLKLVHFHTLTLNFGQSEPTLLALQFAWLS